MSINRRTFLRATAAAIAAQTALTAQQRKPNFLVILADDMGFADAGCYGGDIDTPHLDNLAQNGLRFTQLYSTARCGPSRNCLLSGYYAQQNAADIMTPGNIPEWTRMAPDYLKPLGYRCYHSGKWHIRFKPVAGAGFHHSYTLMDLNRYFTPQNHLIDDSKLPAVKPEDGYYATKAIASHAIDFLKEHASQHKSDPFYLYLPFNAPHFPLHALQEDIDLYRNRYADGWDAARNRRWKKLRAQGLVNCDLAPLEPDMRPSWNTPDAELKEKVGPGEVVHAVAWNSLNKTEQDFQRTKMAIHAAMITRMDKEIGRVLDQLKAMDAFRDTVILFLSDNGASSEQLIRADGHDANSAPGSAHTHLCLGPGWASSSNAPFRLHKSWVHEGGISSPLIAHWPAGIRDKGKVRDQPCHFIDIMPTLIELGGGKPSASHAPGAPPLPGQSLVPALAKNGTARNQPIYFNHSNNRALRLGDWKVVAAGAKGPWELYNMRTDRCEQKDLSKMQPARVEEMAKIWTNLDQEFVRVREAAKPDARPKQGGG